MISVIARRLDGAHSDCSASVLVDAGAIGAWRRDRPETGAWLLGGGLLCRAGLELVKATAGLGKALVLDQRDVHDGAEAAAVGLVAAGQHFVGDFADAERAAGVGQDTVDGFRQAGFIADAGSSASATDAAGSTV